ncbi:hypothetical protein MSP8887_02084 [Marinomonas spartinae]|uniref:hypothetical protein n=1 Tax=Marinomonas spartinae TaxID=1792290 RepID=UPI000808CCC9|nr:hypothetical protein [Marinomonas spartinae]SBS34067.1 hypothetical protein MSP8887_02084 [Marinomonas spartinae]
MKITLSISAQYLAWLVVAIALGMTVAYLYTGWPVIAVYFGVPSGILSALAFFLVDKLFLKYTQSYLVRFSLRVICMLIISVAVFSMFALLK